MAFAGNVWFGAPRQSHGPASGAVLPESPGDPLEDPDEDPLDEPDPLLDPPKPSACPASGGLLQSQGPHPWPSLRHA
jgi:hypothetical protein